MVSRVFSAGIDGINGYIVTVECLLSGGLPRLDVVGLPTGAVSEAGERVRAAAKSCSFDWPVSRLTVNLAPADTRKAGTAFDLPILLSILAAAGEINALPQDALFFGELSLSGELRPVRGALSMALAARSADFRAVYVPAANAQEASYADSLTVYPVRTLSELINHLSGRKQLVPCPPPPEPKPAEHDLDYAHVLGQHLVKRALEVAAAGGHNVLLSGSPGSGKSMMAKRFSSILPPLSHDERLDVIRVWSAVGRAQEAVERAERPFRAPHHTISGAGLVGGGTIPHPGEISLAHNGLLFLDELAEFSRRTLDALRQPIEDKQVSISRVNGTHTFPSNFMFVTAMNPCPCGYYPSAKCRCTDYEIIKYRGKISGPIMDRMDIQKEVHPVDFFTMKDQRAAYSSAELRKKVESARKIQQTRYKDETGISCNAQMTTGLIQKYCELDSESLNLLRESSEKYGYSARVIHKLLRLARTSADLGGAEKIRLTDIQKVLTCRELDESTSKMVMVK